MRIYTKRGDDGTTGLLYGGWVRKDSAQPVAYGAVDEAQAFLGQARAEAEPGSPLNQVLVALARDLWVLMAELALNQERRDRGRPGQTLVTGEMVLRLETLIDEHTTKFDAPRESVIPGQNRVSAALDSAGPWCAGPSETLSPRSPTSHWCFPT